MAKGSGSSKENVKVDPLKNETTKPEATASTSREVNVKDGSAHPHSGSDTRVRIFCVQEVF